MTDNGRPPYRADHVGSLLRPGRLLTAREQHAAGDLRVVGLDAVFERQAGAWIETANLTARARSGLTDLFCVSVHVADAGAVRTLTLVRPAARNAFDVALYTALAAELESPLLPGREGSDPRSPAS